MEAVDRALICMNGGEGDASYAQNSSLQRQVLYKAKALLDESVAELYRDSCHECLKLADLGCASGPNTLIPLREIIDTIDALSKHLNKKEPVFQVSMNDLFGNDFNTLFKTIPSFLEKLKQEKGRKFGPCFIGAMPGSFYGRLFPNNSLNFVHSSYSLHWRSKIPDGLVNELGHSINRSNIYLAKTSPKAVAEAYLDLFKRDFTLFLRSRSEELTPGGRMLLIMIGRDTTVNLSNNQVSSIMELLGLTINDMVLEGLIEEEKLAALNLPYYEATPEEIKHAIQEEGSFEIRKFEIFKVGWDAGMGDGDGPSRGRYVAMVIRAVVESILVSHIGEKVMDELFKRFARKVHEYMELNAAEYYSIVVSVKKK